MGKMYLFNTCWETYLCGSPDSRTDSLNLGKRPQLDPRVRGTVGEGSGGRGGWGGMDDTGNPSGPHEALSNGLPGEPGPPPTRDPHPS